MRYPAALLVLAVLLAGCGDSPAATEDKDGADSLDPAAGPVRKDNSGTDCTELMVMTPISFDHASSHLPDGFQPRDAAQVFGSPVGAGQAAAFIFTASCATGSWGAGPVNISGVAIAVEAPGIETETAADSHFYLVQSGTDRWDLAEYLESIGWEGVEAPVVHTPVMRPVPGGSGFFDHDEQGFRMGVAGPAENVFQGLSRSWRVLDDGVAYIDYDLDAPLHLGSASCAITPGSVAAHVTGRTECGNDAVGFLLASTHWPSEIVVLDV